VGVLSVFAVLWSGLETWSWSRRSGKVTVDPLTVAKFLAVTCGNLAHIFLVVIFFTSIYWFIFFKEQNFLHVILPTHEQEKEIKHYVISIFALKVLFIIRVIDACHCNTCSCRWWISCISC
jgi:meckelin